MPELMADDGVELVVPEAIDQTCGHDDMRRLGCAAKRKRVRCLVVDDSETDKRKSGIGASPGHDLADSVVDGAWRSEIPNTIMQNRVSTGQPCDHPRRSEPLQAHDASHDDENAESCRTQESDGDGYCRKAATINGSSTDSKLAATPVATRSNKGIQKRLRGSGGFADRSDIGPGAGQGAGPLSSEFSVRPMGSTASSFVSLMAVTYSAAVAVAMTSRLDFRGLSVSRSCPKRQRRRFRLDPNPTVRPTWR